MAVFLFLAYLIPMIMIFVYSLVQLSLILNQRKYEKPVFDETLSENFLPTVTIQLPIYNEKYVIERLINSVCRIIYPKEKLEIQILDDSTDETTELICEFIKPYQDQGFDIKLIRRNNRDGYKAGALKYGLEKAKGEFIAIFDADFLPGSRFLKKAIPYFLNEKVGVVQTRWGHINEQYSMLTRLQAFGLNAHFFIEQTGRSAGGHYINFNGTAGIWRKSTISDAGGWSADTITEDLDLSYRAQLKGWKFVYLEDLVSPAELPVTMPAIRSQQYRWMKGGAECFMKNAKRVIKSPIASFSTKLHGLFHLMNSSVFLFVFLISIASIVLTLHPTFLSEHGDWLRLTVFFQINWLILGAFYWLAFRKNGKSIAVFVGRFFLFLTYMMGLSLHNAVAVLEGYLGRKTPFVRTPKFNINLDNDTWSTNIYRVNKLGFITYLELALTILFGVCLTIDLYKGYWGMVFFHSMCLLGYGLVAFFTIRHAKS